MVRDNIAKEGQIWEDEGSTRVFVLESNVDKNQTMAE